MEEQQFNKLRLRQAKLFIQMLVEATDHLKLHHLPEQLSKTSK
jgi:hypothetical protein